jgi:hypothetical protein
MSPISEYLKALGSSAATLNIKGNNAAAQRLYGSKGVVPALSIIPHSPVPGVVMTREATLNYLLGKGFRTNTPLEEIGAAADMLKGKLPEPILRKVKSLVNYSSPTEAQSRIANAAAVADTALSFLPVVGDVLRPSRFLEHKALYGTPMTNLIPLYTAHKEIARPILERELLKKSIGDNKLSNLEKALLTRMLK